MIRLLGTSHLRPATAFVTICLLLSTFASRATADDNNLVYHIFVRSFADSNEPGNEKAIGDLNGIANHLDDYLNDGKPNTDHDLEAGILWLMPIFPAGTYHGYDVDNYREVNPQYGSLDDLKNLVKKAHDRGVRIILDIPFNHTSRNHEWFKKALDGNAAMQKRYFFRVADEHLTDGWHKIQNNGVTFQYFGLFDKSMPDLNFDNADIRNDVKQIAKFWLDLGIDGFRLDAAKHIYGDTFGALAEPQILRNNDWWLEFSNFCYAVNPKAVLVGEVLGDRESLRRHSYGLEALLDQPFMHDAREQMGFPKPGFLNRLKDSIQQERDVNNLAPHSPNCPFSPFLFIASHDENPRLASKLADLKRYGMHAEIEQAYRVGMSMLLTMGQFPVIYNGDELMQRGYKWNGGSGGDDSGIFDETLREPFPWYKSGAGSGQTGWFRPRFDAPNDGVSREEQNGEGGMLNLVRGLANLRTKHPALANGEIGEIPSDTNDWMVFERVQGGHRYLVLINPTDGGKDYQFHEGWHPRYFNAQLIFWSDGKLKKWVDETANSKHIERKVFVPPYGVVVIKKS